MKSFFIKDFLNEENPNLDISIIKLDSEIRSVVAENDEALNIHKSPLNFIRYYLNEEKERELYNQYSLGHNNLWRYFITKNILHEEYKESNLQRVIKLDDKSLQHIILLHNSDLNQDEVYDRYLKLKKIREEL